MYLATTLVALALNSPASPEAEKLLGDLAVELAAARASESIALVKCPASIDPLVGLTEDAVHSRLGAPDLDQPGTGFDGEDVKVRQYLFAPPHAGWIGMAVSAGGYTAVAPFGEPFTVLRLYYDLSGKMLAARCYDRPN
ncbi:hypothetical protein [Marilutibacter spongiae]|uniref:Uncharacterized protein n=1 Tax=Marilutibacter spongiae TaxID=2025720 RepID=A0A7W3TPM3_9GAMM|nr:hypothetical protein [Lysobacter spongiae]MBB1062167.1 hypothetical protein [Lysobacter spongiae]